MFNFIFEGKLGEILAPVLPLNQLFLAIQHGKNAEMQDLILSNKVDFRQNGESGYGAVHVAVRYSNQIALEVLLSRGVSIDALDSKGNSTLHYAAKYNNLDMCRYLYENGCSPSIRNQKNETAYDVAENHLIRQYLMPLQIQCDMKQQQQQPQAPSGSFMGGQYQLHNPQFTAPTNLPPPPMSSIYGHINSGTNSEQAPHAGAPAGHPEYAFASTSQAPSSRFIQADGFHSSASDPALQQKYGHVKLAVTTAPPPMAPMPPPGAGGPGAVNEYSLFGSNQQGSLNRPLYPGMPYQVNSNPYNNTNQIGSSFQPMGSYNSGNGGVNNSANAPLFYQPNQQPSSSPPAIFTPGNAHNTQVNLENSSMQQHHHHHQQEQEQQQQLQQQQQQQQYQSMPPPPPSTGLSGPSFRNPSFALQPPIPNGLQPVSSASSQSQIQTQHQQPIIFNPSADTFVSADASSNSVL